MKKLLVKTITKIALCSFLIGATLVPLARAEAFTLNYTIKQPGYTTYTIKSPTPQPITKPSTTTTKPSTTSNTSQTVQTPAPAPTTSVAIPTGLTAEEAAMVKLVNNERVRAGLKPLQVDMRLVQTARAKSQDMIQKNYFGHTSPTYGNPYQQMKAAGITGYSVLGGENIAGNSSVEGAHKSLMNSPGHRANLLDARYTHLGIGIVNGGPYGKMFTQHFAGNW